METPHGRIVRDPIARGDITAIAAGQFGDMVKAVADVSRRALIRNVVQSLVSDA